MTDNIAILEGYTEEYVAECDDYILNILAKPEDDFDGRIRVWDMDNQEFININGWMYSFEIVKRHA